MHSALLTDGKMPIPFAVPTGPSRGFTTTPRGAMLRCPFPSKGREEVLVVPTKSKKGTKKATGSKKK